jgi:hypothetical protein
MLSSKGTPGVARDTDAEPSVEDEDALGYTLHWLAARRRVQTELP